MSYPSGAGTSVFQTTTMGRVGQIAEPDHISEVEPVFLDPASTFTGYGIAVKQGPSSNLVSTLKANDAVALVKGVLVIPTIDNQNGSFNAAMGHASSVPGIDGPHGLLRARSFFGMCYGSVAPVKFGQVYIRLSDNELTGRQIGTFEAGTGLATSTVQAVGNVGNATMSTPTQVTGAQEGGYTATCASIRTCSATPSALSGTGNETIGTVSATSAGLVGVYTITCTATTVWNVVKPGGGSIGTAHSGTAFNAGGIVFTITEHSTPSAVADAFTVTVAQTAAATWTVKDPSAVTVATATEGAAFSTQIAFTITAGATPSAISDLFTIAVLLADCVVLPGWTFNGTRDANNKVCIRIK